MSLSLLNSCLQWQAWNLSQMYQLTCSCLRASFLFRSIILKFLFARIFPPLTSQEETIPVQFLFATNVQLIIEHISVKNASKKEVMIPIVSPFIPTARIGILFSADVEMKSLWKPIINFVKFTPRPQNWAISQSIRRTWPSLRLISTKFFDFFSLWTVEQSQMQFWVPFTLILAR